MIPVTVKKKWSFALVGSVMLLAGLSAFAQDSLQGDTLTDVAQLGGEQPGVKFEFMPEALQPVRSFDSAKSTGLIHSRWNAPPLHSSGAMSAMVSVKSQRWPKKS